MATSLLIGVYSVSQAQVVLFTISGTLTSKDDTNNMLPPSITSTSAFTGTVSYDISATGDTAPGNPTYGYYIYNAGGMSMTATIAGNTFASIPPTNGSSDVFIIHDNPPGTYDEFLFETVKLKLNENLITNMTTLALDVDFIASSGTAISADTRPLVAPSLLQFPSLHRLDIYAGSNGIKAFSLSGDITDVTQILPPFLSVTRADATNVLLSWTELATNYVLERALTFTGAWSQIDPPYPTNSQAFNFTTPSSVGNQFFRLRQH